MADLPLDEASVEVVGRYDMVTERCLCRDFNHETVEDEVSKRPRGRRDGRGGGGRGIERGEFKTWVRCENSFKVPAVSYSAACTTVVEFHEQHCCTTSSK